MVYENECIDRVMRRHVDTVLTPKFSTDPFHLQSEEDEYLSLCKRYRGRGPHQGNSRRGDSIKEVAVYPPGWRGWCEYCVRQYIKREYR